MLPSHSLYFDIFLNILFYFIFIIIFFRVVCPCNPFFSSLFMPNNPFLHDCLDRYLTVLGQHSDLRAANHVCARLNPYKIAIKLYDFSTGKKLITL